MKFKFIVFLSSIFLTSCSTVVEHARIEVMPDLSSSFQILIADNTREELQKYETRAKECGATTKIFGASKPFFLQANVQLKNRDEIDTIILCSDNKLMRTKLTISTIEGYFFKKYQLDFERKSFYMEIFKEFPNEFSFTIPGKIIDIHDNSSHIENYDITKRQIGDNHVVVNIQGNKNGTEIKAINRHVSTLKNNQLAK